MNLFNKGMVRPRTTFLQTSSGWLQWCCFSRGRSLCLVGSKTSLLKSNIGSWEGPHMWVAPHHEHFSLHVTWNIETICYRMINWVSVATSILDTEFPSFGVCMHLANALRLDLNKAKMPQSSLQSVRALAGPWGIDKVSHPISISAVWIVFPGFLSGESSLTCNSWKL